MQPRSDPVLGLRGHVATIAPVLRHAWRSATAPQAEPFEAHLEDPRVGRVRLRGLLRTREDSDTCVVVVHGLGGTVETHYVMRAARAVEAAGFACLRLALRGADRDGDDFYHAGLSADLDGALASPRLARYTSLLVLGYSLGGHVTLRHALAPADARVRAAAAICAPLDLDRAATHIDRTRSVLYRQHVLRGLNDIYAAVSRKRPVPTPLERVRRARTIREWDGLTVVPRFGFASVADYYARMSVGPRLAQLAVPALLVQTIDDPMVPPSTYVEHLSRATPRLSAHLLESGGHVGEMTRVDLGEKAPTTLEDQVLAWLARFR